MTPETGAILTVVVGAMVVVSGIWYFLPAQTKAFLRKLLDKANAVVAFLRKYWPKG